MLISFKRSQAGVILRVKIRNRTASGGNGLTGLDHTSSGLRISTIADNEAAATEYTVAGSKVETITTLGTFAAPTATKCRFKEVDATKHPGIYEIQLDNARFAVSSAKSLLVSINGATNAAECDALIPLVDLDPYDANGSGIPSAVWSETVPGSFVAGQAGKVLGDNLDVAVSTRPSAADVTAAVFAKLFGTFTYEEVITIIAAFSAGKSSGFASNAPVFRDLDDTQNVISGTLDANGNRTAVTLTP